MTTKDHQLIREAIKEELTKQLANFATREELDAKLRQLKAEIEVEIGNLAALTQEECMAIRRELAAIAVR